MMPKEKKFINFETLEHPAPEEDRVLAEAIRPQYEAWAKVEDMTPAKIQDRFGLGYVRASRVLDILRGEVKKT